MDDLRNLVGLCFVCFGSMALFFVNPRKYNNAWRPRGRNLMDTTNEDLMTFDLACNILSTGAYFKKKAGRRSSVKRYFFVGYGNNSTAFLKYFKDHAAAQSGDLD